MKIWTSICTLSNKSLPDKDDWQETLETQWLGLAGGEPKCDRGSELFVACNLQRHEATGEEGVKKYHFRFRLLINPLWEALEMKGHSGKYMNVSDLEVTDEDGI